MNAPTQTQEIEYEVDLRTPVDVDSIDQYLCNQVPSQSCHRSWYDELIVHELGKSMYDSDCWGEIYFHVKYKRASPDLSIDTTKNFSISGTKVTPKLIRQLKTELSGKS